MTLILTAVSPDSFIRYFFGHFIFLVWSRSVISFMIDIIIMVNITGIDDNKPIVAFH